MDSMIMAFFNLRVRLPAQKQHYLFSSGRISCTRGRSQAWEVYGNRSMNPWKWRRRGPPPLSPASLLRTLAFSVARRQERLKEQVQLLVLSGLLSLDSSFMLRLADIWRSESLSMIGLEKVKVTMNSAVKPEWKENDMPLLLVPTKSTMAACTMLMAAAAQDLEHDVANVLARKVNLNNTTVTKNDWLDCEHVSFTLFLLLCWESGCFKWSYYSNITRKTLYFSTYIWYLLHECDD